MRKYLVAGVVAVVVFAFAAFAASLNVDAGTLAFGVDEIGDCGGEAEILYSHHQESNELAYVDAIIAQFPDAGGECDGYGVYLTSPVGVSVEAIQGDQAVFVVTNGVDVAGSNGWDSTIIPRQGIPIEDLDGEISLKVYSKISQTGPGSENTGQTPGAGAFKTGAFG
jgi:hypothetical protein